MKTYDWQEIKTVLIKKLKKTNSIMTFGTIGSCNIDEDVDIIITKKPYSKSSTFYKEIHELFDYINSYLQKKYKSKLIRLPGLSNQGELLNFIKVNKDDLIFHVLIYVSLPQIKNEWKPWTNKEENIISLLKNGYSCLMGNKKDLFIGEFAMGGNYDFMFTRLSHSDRINFPYPEKILLNVMNNLYAYIFNKRLNLQFPIAKNKRQVKNIFYRLCDIIDKLNKN